MPRTRNTALLVNDEFALGEEVVWKKERATIHSDAMFYRDTRYYDIKLLSTGQLILGVDEVNLHRPVHRR